MFDLVIRNGQVVTETEVAVLDIGITGEKIIALGPDLESGQMEIDARGLIVLPGGIDSHVHISQPSGAGIVMADDFASGTLSALMGGNTTVMPFFLQQKGESLRAALTAYHALAEGRCHTDVSFHLIVSDPTPGVLGQEIPALVAHGYTSLKVFMTYEGLRLRDDEILATLDAARDSKALVLVHCENEDAIRYLIGKHEAAGDLAPAAHATTRPVAAEREPTHRALSLAEIVDVPIVIVHVSNRAAMEEIQRARTRGVKVAGETCPQYLMLTADDLDREGWEGAKYVCSPPPRDREAQAACWEGLETGVFDLFSSDHCSFRFDDPAGKLNEKGARNFRWIPSPASRLACRSCSRKVSARAASIFHALPPSPRRTMPGSTASIPARASSPSGRMQTSPSGTLRRSGASRTPTCTTGRIIRPTRACRLPDGRSTLSCAGNMPS